MARPVLRALIALFLLAELAACGNSGEPLEAVVDRGELRFVTRNSATTYYLGRGGPRGYEYDLAKALADELAVELVVIQAFTIGELFEALDRGEADIAGAGLTRTDGRSARFPATRAYARQAPQAIYKAGERKPRSLDDLRDMRIVVLRGSSHEALLKKLRKDDRPWLAWDVVTSSDPMELLLRVSDGRADVAIVDSRDFFVQQSLVPQLAVGFQLSDEKDIVWYLAPGAGDSLLAERIDSFLAEADNSGRLEALAHSYFDRDETISRVDSQTFVSSVERDLNDYRQLIEIVAREQNLPWELLAAMSYQESHWDPKATSRTGVRGMMMLTRATAEELGVTNRTDPGQSLRGGARYFRNLRRRLPDDIHEPDRSWLALAAYNIGMGHLEDARVLTQRQGGDPHLWEDVMAALPLLEDSQHYGNLRYGYARGTEAVRYVQNIRHYFNVLRWQTARSKRPRAPADAQELLPDGLRELTLHAL